MYIYKRRVNMVTLVEADPMDPFSTVTPRYRGGNYSFSWIVPLYP